MTMGYSHTAIYVAYAHNAKCTLTDGYGIVETLKKDHQMLYKIIGYRPATGCNICFPRLNASVIISLALL